jgi:hypothetical protein
VVEEADKVMRKILDTYPEPNKTFDDLRAMRQEGHALDPLRTFSESCREELRGLTPL